MPDEETTATTSGVSDTASPTPEVEREPDSPATEAEPEAEEPETFPRAYVEKLRQENGRYRQRAQQADQYAQRLHTELVRATGRLADPTDLPFNAEHLDDQDSLTAAIDDLLARKPHLRDRRPIGDIGQGAKSPAAGTVDLAAILRERAK
ncbi:Conserved protein of unknown function [Mycobacterium canettii CIPT 140060008]|uniref:Terminase small subunit n=1 Tax=Mycobacterium canetti TaxID=78331 RepID=A0ABV1ME82_9MYCO|nr:hypothetical protein [Mycobacterium canetti]CCK53033.1 Conserved protein of unknown function [Mycobacterium canettii CIPT 140060008]